MNVLPYRKAGIGYKQIAKELDLSANSVKSYCRRNGLSSEALEQSLPESACENCGKSIEQKKGKKKKRFCSDIFLQRIRVIQQEERLQLKG